MGGKSQRDLCLASLLMLIIPLCCCRKDPTIAKPKAYHSTGCLENPTAETSDGTSAAINGGETQLDSCQCDNEQSKEGGSDSQPVQFSVGEEPSNPSMILNVSSLTDMMELSLNTKSDTSKQLPPASSQPQIPAAAVAPAMKDELLIDVGTSAEVAGLENTNSSPAEPPPGQHVSGNDPKLDAKPTTEVSEEKSGEVFEMTNHTSSSPGGEAPPSPEPAPEFALVEYDLVNTMHVVGNSRFYSVLVDAATARQLDIPDVSFQQGRTKRRSRSRGKSTISSSDSAPLTSPRIELKAAVNFDDKPQLFQSLNG